MATSMVPFPPFTRYVCHQTIPAPRHLSLKVPQESKHAASRTKTLWKRIGAYKHPEKKHSECQNFDTTARKSLFSFLKMVNFQVLACLQNIDRNFSVGCWSFQSI